MFENRPQMRAQENSQIMKADKGCETAAEEVREAYLALGKLYYEENKDKEDAAYIKEVSNITDKIKTEVLWSQYRLSLEGKIKCQKCGAIITSDSIFCNKCAEKVPEWDFSGLKVDNTANVEVKEVSAAPIQGFCTSCGKPITPGTAFCENCGAKIG